MASKRKRTAEDEELEQATKCLRVFQSALVRKAEAEQMIKDSEALVQPQKHTYTKLICDFTSMTSESLMEFVKLIELHDVHIVWQARFQNITRANEVHRHVCGR